MYRRREYLLTLGTIGTVATAGCSESEPAENQGQQSSPTTSTVNSDSDTETPTEAEPEGQFATTGNDSVLIESQPSELLISESDIPREGYTVDSTDTASFDEYDDASRNFSQGEDYTIIAAVEVWNEVSQAEARYNALDISTHLGMSADESEELDIAVESQLSTGSTNGTYARYIRIRDANVFGFIDWFRPETAVPRQDIGNLAMTMHERWR